MDINKNKFPRHLTSIELMLLFSILPENKTGYNIYRDKIKDLVITGLGRFDGGNFILGKENTQPDLSLPSQPVFAIGTNVYEQATIDITIHEEFDNEIEFDISVINQSSIPETLTEIRKWNYSEWNPGDKAPEDNSDVREIKIIDEKYILAIAPFQKKIWIHEYSSGINYLIPVTNFYNELMRVCGIRDAKLALNPSNFFEDLEKFSDIELKLTFISYNKYLRRLNIKEPIPIDDSRFKKSKNIFSIFRKGTN